MGNCTAVIKKKASGRGFGRSIIAQVSLSTSYATGGDTVPLSIFGLRRLSALLVSSGHTTPGGHHVEVIPGATEYAAPLLRVRNVTTGAELTNATDNSAQSIIVEAITTAYK